MTHKRLLVAVVLLAASGVLAQTKSTSDTVSSTFVIQPPPPQPMVIIGGSNIIEIKDKDQKPMVLVSTDGKITYGDDYPPAASARVFWEKIAESYPIVCKAIKVKP